MCSESPEGNHILV